MSLLEELRANWTAVGPEGLPVWKGKDDCILSEYDI